MVKKVLFMLTVLGLFSNAVLAQALAWGGGADQNDLSFGFSFQYVMQEYKIVKKPDWQRPFYDTEAPFTQLTSPLTSISSKGKPGFSVGFITRYRLTEHLEARTTPSLVFADRQLDYTFENPNENASRAVSSTMVDIPLLIKLKSDRVHDFRAYIVGGVKYSQALGGKGQSDANALPLEKKLKNIRGFASYEAGIGCDIYFEFFKLSPEIKLANSFGNVLVPENHPFASPIDKLFLRSLMFTLHFE
ncbi:PorT family protein [Mucilaginibacter sp. Bleaf8]|uniref:type IX secretion/gliding motility protein PorT/SprT n=1 Tax=Mucilaginibacter sp. Bleaf8 TaxID=2834430 RepID=UPI001BCF95DD|nr:outer membrane beta-barrel protein [Mucilaginibacter sp. Bleaf8]MBS7564561.1 PorT family protein [Mucilaginibacter sp. Bleaf8]